jgi:hypothetical protein
VAFEQDARGALLLLTPVAGSRLPNDASPTGSHVNLISRMLERQRSIDGADHHEALVDRLGTAPQTMQSAFLRIALASTEELWSAVGSMHFSHGDLTPWNCLDCDGTLGVVDWEMAGFRIAGWDAVHYVAQVESVAHRAPIEAAAEQLLNMPLLARVGGVASRACVLDVPDPERWPVLQLLSLLDGAVALSATQADISARGIAVRTHAIARILGLEPPRAET